MAALKMERPGELFVLVVLREQVRRLPHLLDGHHHHHHAHGHAYVFAGHGDLPCWMLDVLVAVWFFPPLGGIGLDWTGLEWTAGAYLPTPYQYTVME